MVIILERGHELAQAARGISDDGIRYGQPGPPVVAAPGSPEAARGAYSGLLAVSVLTLFVA